MNAVQRTSRQDGLLVNNSLHAGAARWALRFTPVALAVMLMLGQPAMAANRVWDGGAGGANNFWDLVANWNTTVPGLGDIATLGAFNTRIRDYHALQSFSGTGTLTMDSGLLSYEAASSVGGLVLNSGTLGGKGTLTTGTFAWNGGYLGNTDSLNGTVNVNGAATLGSFLATNYGQKLNLKDNSTWNDHGWLYLEGAGASGAGSYNESSVSVAAGKTLGLTGGVVDTSTYRVYGDGSLNNAGVITKTGSNLLTVESKFNNTGTLNVNGGETILYGTSTLGGAVNVATGATLRTYGVTTFASGGTTTGAGNLIFEGINLVTSGTRTFGGATNKTLAGGSFGGAGAVTFNKLLWTAGTMGYAFTPGGVTTVTGTTTFGEGAVVSVDYGRALKLNGGATWTGQGDLFIGGPSSEGGIAYGASVVSLAAGKTFSLAGNVTLGQYHFQGDGAFNNAGTLSKTGSSLLYLHTNFNNTGTVMASEGTIWIIGGRFNNTGVLHANGGAIEVQAAFLPQWNATSKTLTAGTYRVTGAQPIALNLGWGLGGTFAVLKTNRASIYLEGAGAALMSTFPSTPVNALKVLSTNQGVLSLTGGATLGITGSLTNKLTGSLFVGTGSTLTLSGASGVYNQLDTASTFIGGTLTANSMTFNGGSLSAGNGAGLVGNGVLNASIGGVTFSAASRLDQDVTTAGWDKLSVATGNVVVDGTLQATFGTGIATGKYRFLTTGTGSVSGSFDSLVSNLDTSLYTVSAVYGAKFVDLKVTAVPALSSVMQAVPEPQTYALMASGLALLGWTLRHRRAGSRSRTA